jgi:sodium/proline symporter
MPADPPMAWVFAGYLAVLLLIGFLTQRRTRGLEGFLLGDRRMGPWLTALSYEATAYSGWLMLGFPGRAFTRGLVAMWVGLFCVIGDAVNWLVVSERLRVETARLKALTIPQYLERRFARPGGHAVQAVASLAIALFMLIYLWSQFVAAGKAIMTMLGLGYPAAVLVSAAVIVAYTFQGGYRAVVWTDALQGAMMLVALLVLPIACLVRIGGPGALLDVIGRSSIAAAASPQLAMTSGHLGEWFAGLSGLVLAGLLFEDAGVGAGYPGMPHICVRFMAIRDPRALRPAFVLSIAFAILVCAGAVMVGLVAHGWFVLPGTPPGDPRPILSDPEQVLPRLAIAVLPGWLAGFVVSAIMASIMSTASGFLMSVTSSMSEDVYHRILRPGAGEQELVFVSRAVTLALGTGALALALTTDPLDPHATVYRLVLYGWGGLAGCFCAPVVLALTWRRMSRAACLAGMLSGGMTVVLWRSVPPHPAFAYEVIPAIAVSAATILVVSAWSPAALDRAS